MTQQEEIMSASEGLSRMSEQSHKGMRNRMAHEHAKLNLETALDVVFSGARIGTLQFLPFYREVLRETGITPPPERFYQHALRVFCAAKFAYHALSNNTRGGWLLCLSREGATPVALLKFASLLIPRFSGQNVWLLDFSQSTPTLSDEDIQIEIDPRTQLFNQITPNVAPTRTKSFAYRLAERYPQLQLATAGTHTLNSAKQQSWSFAFIDVDYYLPTLDCLNIIEPSCIAGCMAIVQEFDSLYTGVHPAVVEFCNASDIAYGALDSGQAILCKSVIQ